VSCAPGVVITTLATTALADALVTTRVPVTPSIVAEIVAVPCAPRVTRPVLETLAMLGSDEDQTGAARPVSGLLLASFGVAVSWSVAPVSPVPAPVTDTIATGAVPTGRAESEIPGSPRIVPRSTVTQPASWSWTRRSQYASASSCAVSRPVRDQLHDPDAADRPVEDDPPRARRRGAGRLLGNGDRPLRVGRHGGPDGADDPVPRGHVAHGAPDRVRLPAHDVADILVGQDRGAVAVVEQDDDAVSHRSETSGGVTSRSKNGKRYGSAGAWRSR
jgi:hypothetical protein